MNSQRVNTRKIKAKRMPLEMHWVQTNIDRFDHLLFFNHFTNYCKDKAIRRFKLIVNEWIQDEAAKERLMFNFWSWQKSKESKIFWKEKEVAIALSNSNAAELRNEESSTLISASTVSNNHSADSTIMPTILEELECFFSENINHPGSESNFSIDGANISEAFYNFQTHAHNLLRTDRLHYESYCTHLLSLSSILLIKKTTNTDERIHPFFTNPCTIEKIKQTLFKEIGMNTQQFPRTLLTDIMDINQAVYRKCLSKEEGCLKLMQLAVAEKSRGNKKYINCIRRLMEALPYENESSIIKETKLNTRYILPICQSLFDNLCDNESVCFNLVNENNYESKVSQLEISSRRPDGNITVTTDNDARTIGFFEAKSMTESKNHKLINIDLIRLGIFSRNSIDMHNLKSVLAVQAVGSYLTFYLVRKMSSDMNIMIELDHVRFPISINELPTIFGFSDRILDILHIFENECENLENNTAIVATTRKTIRSP